MQYQWMPVHLGDHLASIRRVVNCRAIGWFPFVYRAISPFVATLLSADVLNAYVAAIHEQGGDMNLTRLPPVFFLCLVLLFPGALHADESAFAQARSVFMQALQERDGALEQATARFKSLVRNEPGNPVYLAYLGACTALHAREAWMPWSKMRYGEAGVEMIDRALGAAEKRNRETMLDGVPLTLQTQFIAAQTFIDMPDAIFHRRDRGRRLLKKIIRAPAFAVAPASFRQAVLDADRGQR